MGKFSKKKKSFSGLRLAAAYGAAPNRLGFCGPQGKGSCQKISLYLGGKLSGLQARNILEKFEAAYSYLRLIARKNKIKDPFDFKVVEAFWVGNKLLERVAARDIKEMVLKEFTRPGLLSESEAEKRIKFIRNKAFPHHSFHVYVLGAITGRINLKSAWLKDICRVGWGTVEKMESSGGKSKIIVLYKPIVEGKKGRFKFGREIKKEISWNKKAFPGIKIGDQVSFHWDVLCQKLSRSNISNLEKYTKHALELANS